MQDSKSSKQEKKKILCIFVLVVGGFLTLLLTFLVVRKCCHKNLQSTFKASASTRPCRQDGEFMHVISSSSEESDSHAENITTTEDGELSEDELESDNPNLNDFSNNANPTAQDEKQKTQNNKNEPESSKNIAQDEQPKSDDNKNKTHDDKKKPEDQKIKFAALKIEPKAAEEKKKSRPFLFQTGDFISRIDKPVLEDIKFEKEKLGIKFDSIKVEKLAPLTRKIYSKRWYAYQILGLPITASQYEISKQYRSLCLLYSPDKFANRPEFTPEQKKNHSKDAEEYSKALNTAYAILNNVPLRYYYDRFCLHAKMMFELDFEIVCSEFMNHNSQYFYEKKNGIYTCSERNYKQFMKI